MLVLGTAVRCPQSLPGGIDPALQSVLTGSVLPRPPVLVASAVNLFLFASHFFSVSGIGPRLRILNSTKI